MSFGQLQDQTDEMEPAGILVAPIKTDPNFYADPKDFRRELKRAQTICLDLSAANHELINNVRVGLSPDAKSVIGPLANMVKSVLGHPCAFVWAARLYSNQDYSFSHAVRSSIFAVVVGRRMGLERDSLMDLALGALLCQIGKARLPKQLLEKQGEFSAAELGRIRGHVDAGVALLKKGRNINPAVIEIVQNHCERFDGTGYPEGKQGDDIPVLARIVGLVDSYDAMTSVKPHTDTVLSSSDCIKFLFGQRDGLFQGQLVEEFNQALGVYPTGTFVELSNGQVALVTKQNESSRLQPNLLLVLDEDKQPLERLSSLDLKQHRLKFENQPLSISGGLGINEYSLDPTEIMRKWAGQNRGWNRLKVV